MALALAAGGVAAQCADQATLDLRDELVAKQMDLEAEYDKDEPDPARITALRKEIADIRARLRAAGDWYGGRPWGHGRGGGMPYRHAGWAGHCGCGGWW